MPQASAQQRKRSAAAGFTIVELMVAITIGLLVLAGLVAIFVDNSRARNEIERANRQIESGRYALEVLSHDLRNAGYYAEFNPQELSPPAELPDPCKTGLDDLRTALPVHVQGVDDVTAGAVPSCLTDVKPGTDILVVRRVAGCVAGTPGCDAPAGVPYFQASLCSAELEANDVTKHYALDTEAGNLKLHKRDCTTLADKRRYRTDIYFVAKNNEGSDGVPTLKRAALGATSFTIEPVVEGVDDMQFEYGVDTSGDGRANVFSSNPQNVAEWQSVVSVKIHVLARNVEVTPGYSDSKTYHLGLKADGTAKEVGPFGDGYKRHVFQSTVNLYNPSGRRATR